MSACSLDSFTHSFDIGQVEGGLVMCFGKRRFGVFPEGTVNHLCGMALLGQSGGVTDLLCSGC